MSLRRNFRNVSHSDRTQHTALLEVKRQELWRAVYTLPFIFLNNFFSVNNYLLINKFFIKLNFIKLLINL